MTRILHLVIAFVWFVQRALGQSSDSIAVVTKAWNTTAIDKGVVWKHGHFDQLFGSQQDINFIEINLRKYRRKIRIAADSVKLDSASRIATAHNAMAAIHGGFFDL